MRSPRLTLGRPLLLCLLLVGVAGWVALGAWAASASPCVCGTAALPAYPRRAPVRRCAGRWCPLVLSVIANVKNAVKSFLPLPACGQGFTQFKATEHKHGWHVRASFATAGYEHPVIRATVKAYDGETVVAIYSAKDIGPALPCRGARGATCVGLEVQYHPIGAAVTRYSLQLSLEYSSLADSLQDPTEAVRRTAFVGLDLGTAWLVPERPAPGTRGAIRLGTGPGAAEVGTALKTALRRAAACPQSSPWTVKPAGPALMARAAGAWFYNEGEAVRVFSDSPLDAICTGDTPGAINGSSWLWVDDAGCASATLRRLY